MKKMKFNIKLMFAIASLLLMPFIKQSGGSALAQAPNVWTQKANFGGTARDGAFAFAIGTKGYMGGGNNNGNFKNDVWEYNPATDAWTQKAGVPANEYLPSSFVIGSKGYVLCGYNTANAVYEFDPVANTWTAKASFPGANRYITVGLSIGSKGYCGGGYTPVSPYPSYNDFYEFDPVGNTWTAKASMPGGGRTYAVGFNLGTKGYVGCGNINGNATNDFYEYDPTGNTWTAKANVGPVGRVQSFGIVVNGKGYVGGGGQGYDPTGFYEYDVIANTWTAKASIPVNRAGAVGFAIGAKLYIGTGGDPFDNNYYSSTYFYRNDFYEWNSCGPVLNVSPASAFLCGSGSVTLTASGANTYTWSNGTANGGVFNPTVTTRYIVTGALSGTCTSTNSVAVTVLVSTLAANQTLSPAAASFACNGNATINLTTENGVNYYLRNDANNAILAGPFAGTGSTLNINTGNIASTTTLNINAKRTSGGLTFDGVDDGVKTSGAPFNFAGDFTMEAWVKSPVGANGGLNLIFGLPGSSTDAWVGLNNGYPAFAIGGPGGNSVPGATAITDGKWHHIAAVRTSGVKNLYVDGILAVTENNANPLTPNAFLEIGSYGGGYNFKGQIDEVRVYSVGLTQPQVAASMTACATGNEAGLMLYYNFEDGAGSGVANDIAGLDNNGTLANMNNTTAWSFGVENCIACAATQLTTKPIITINAITNQPVTAVNPNICVSGTGTLTLPGSDLNIDYVLRDNANNAIISGPLAGTGSGLSFTTGVISTTKTYNVLAKSQSAYLDFDGVDDYVVTNTVGLPSGNAPFTMEALIKPDPSNGSGTIVYFGNAGTNNQANCLRLGGTNQLVAYAWANDLGAYTGPLADGAWHHVAVTYDGGTRIIYMDGVLVGQDNPGPLNVTLTNGVSVGAAIMSGSPFDIYKGGIDEVRVWSVARTQADIQANMNSSLTGAESGLQVYYKFTSGTNSPTAKDVAGGDNTGTLTNMNTATAWKYYSTPCTLQLTTTPTITINALPTVTTTSATICSGKSAVLVPSGAATYTITGGTFTVSPSANASYSVTGTSSVGCVSSNTAVASVVVNASPTVTINSATICSGSSVTLTPGGGAATYTITGNTFTVTPATTTSYSVTGTNANGCLSSNTAVATVSVNVTPTLSVNSGSICSNKSFTVLPSGAGTYTITGGTFTVSPLTTTSYSVTGTGTNACAASNTIVSTVTVFASPTLAVNSATICSGNSVAIVPTGANTYTISGNNFTVTPLTTTSYSVTGTSTAGCISSNTAVASVSVNASPTLAVNNATICSNSSVAIVPTGANTYTISGNNFTVTPLTTTSYSVTGTGTNGCVGSNTAVSTISVNATPTLAVNNATICSNNSVAIVPTGAGTYTITGGNFTVTPLTNTSYSVTGTGTNGCAGFNTAVSTISVNTTPTLAVNNATVCSGNSVAIVPTGANTYTITGGNFTVTPLTTTAYSVTGTATNGCAGFNTAVSTISVNATPTISANSGSICSNKSFTIIPGGANTYTITGGNFTVTPLTTASYSVTGTGTNGCVSSTFAVSNVTVNATPTLAVNNATICSGRSVTLVPTGANTYTITGNTFTVTPLTTTSYSVTGTSTAGCISSNTAVASVSVNASPILTVNNATVCSGNSVVITPTGAVSYTITGNTFTVTPLTTTVYSVTGTGSNGCVSSNTAVSTVAVNATPTLSVNDGTVCSGSSVVITPTGAATYSITGGTFTVSPATTTSYSVTGTSAAGCVASNTAVSAVSVNTNPIVTVNSGAVCTGNSITLVPAGAATYTISGNNFTVNPTTTTSYSVTGTDINGCVSAEAVSTVTVNGLPTVVATAASNTICIGQTGTLTVSGAATYSWESGQTDATISVTPTTNTTYTVTGTDVNGCSAIAMVTQNTDICEGIKQTKAALISGIYPNPNNGEFVVEVAENVEVTVVNALGQTVYNEMTTGLTTHISISHLANGIYFVKAAAHGNQQIVKIVKD